MGSRNNIFLTDEEKAKFAKALYDIRKSRPIAQWSECFEEASKVLPKDRRAIAKKSHPSEVIWLNQLYKSLEKNFGYLVAPKAGSASYITPEEKLAFAMKVNELRQTQPPTPWKECFAQANMLLPEPKRLSSGIDHPTKLSWLSQMLKEMEKQSEKVAPVQRQSDSKPKIHRVELNDEEKLAFAKAFLIAKKANPEGGAANAIRAANSQMPEHRRIGVKVDSVNQIPWIKPLIEKLESQSKTSQPEKRKWLDDEERLSFAKTIYERRKADSEESWKKTFQEANKTLSFDKRFPDSLNHPGQIAWIKPLLQKLEKEDKARLVIDHRHIPALPEASPAPVATESHVKVIPAGESGKKGKEGARIYLKPEEKMLFAEAAYRARITNLGWSWNQCLVEANKSLPEYRRFGKLPPSPSQMPWLPPILEEISKRPATSQDKIVPEPEGGYEIIPEQPAAPAPAPAIDMQAVIANAIAVAVQEQVKALMGGNLTSAVASAMAPVINSAKLAEKKPDPRKKVIVVGLLPVQTNEVQKDFGSFYDLRFFHSNTPIPQIRESMKNVDFAILMTRFVSHSMATAMRTHPGFIFCDGNSTALKMKLKEKLSQ